MNEVYKLHSQLIKSGLHHDPLSLRRLLFLACSASGSASYASSLLLSSQSPDTVSWNTVIRFLSHSAPSRSVSLFYHMRSNSISLDHFTFPFVLKSCSHLHLDRRDLHSLILKLGFDSDVYVQNSLISFYGSCGFLDFALKIFEEMPQRDLVSWSSMISCLVNNGFAFQALNTFRQMQVDGNVKPDEVTVVKVISAVSRLGALELGRWVHTFVRRNGLRITVKLGTALIDMYSRSPNVSMPLAPGEGVEGVQEEGIVKGESMTDF
ncbi:Pentatricopeptide repeat [Dillenia turbinata]|uniref:Pentatricopeptide repeat n=1 Tax=Dillenia turbinata TaxID=194707 RepID=A0AAN8V242_9MAGN